MSRKLTGAYLEGRCRLAGITGGLASQGPRNRAATGWHPLGRPGATAQHPPVRSSLHLSPRKHADEHLPPQRHGNLSFLSRYVQCFRGEKSPTGKLERRSGDWHPSAGPKGNRAGDGGGAATGRRGCCTRAAGAAAQHVAQQLNTYRTTARRQHLAQGPGRRRQQGTTAAGTAGAEPGPGGWGLAARGSARTVAGRLAPGLAAGRTGDAGRRLAEGPGSQGAGAAGGGWRGWRRGLAGGGWGDGAVGRRVAVGDGAGAVGRRSGGAAGGWGRWVKWLRCGAR